tara:strand:+ start:247 stop:408 length:162 start_codon:yes stop_codon:yes gene_type:complete
MKMIWSSGFDRPALRRRMVTKREKYSMYRTVNNLDTIEEENEEEIIENNKEKS